MVTKTTMLYEKEIFIRDEKSHRDKVYDVTPACSR